MTTASGIVSWQAEAAAFGETKIDSDIANSRLAAVNNHRFPGQYYDAETGLSYNYFRDYEAAVGRYVEGDPIGLLGGVNVYGYSLQNAISFFDPEGLFTYNASPPRTVPVDPDLEDKVSCLESCLGMTLVITGGAEKYCNPRKPTKLCHSRNSKHYTHEAVDFGFNSNPNLPGKESKFYCCAGNCEFKYGQTEGGKGPHFHIQTVPGKNGGS